MAILPSVQTVAIEAQDCDNGCFKKAVVRVCNYLLCPDCADDLVSDVTEAVRRQAVKVGRFYERTPR